MRAPDELPDAIEPLTDDDQVLGFQGGGAVRMPMSSVVAASLAGGEDSNRVLADMRAAQTWRDDFGGQSTTSGSIGELGWASSVSGSGAAVSVGTFLQTGVVNIDSGTASTGRSAINLGLSAFGAGLLASLPVPAFVNEWRADVYNLSTVAVEYLATVGLSATPDSAEPATGMFFLYDRLNRGVNWHAVCANGDGSPTRVDTGVPVHENQFDVFRIACDGDGIVRFYIAASTAEIDLDNPVAEITDNLPTATLTGYGPCASIRKTTGGQARLFGLDYFYLRREVAR